MSNLPLGLALLIGLLSLPVRADEPDKSTVAIEARLKTMQQQLDATKTQIETMQRTLDQLAAQVREQRNYQEMRDQLSTAQLELQKNRDEMRQLREQLDQVRRGSGSVAGGTTGTIPAGPNVAQPYVAGASPAGTAAGAATAAKAVVRLVNEYPYDSVFYLNGRRYVVPPYRTIPVEYTPGELSYSVEVWKPVPTQVTLRPGQDFPIRVYSLR